MTHMSPPLFPKPFRLDEGPQKHHCCDVEGVDVLGVTAGAQGSKDASRWRRTLDQPCYLLSALLANTLSLS